MSKEFFAAARNGNTGRVTTLLAAGADVNAEDEDGGTALILAALWGHVECVRALLAAGADVNAKDEDGGTALMFAALGDSVECVRELLAAGAEVNAKDQYGKTALIWAAFEGEVNCVRALLAAGAEVNAKDKDGMTKLMLAAHYGRVECVRVLLAAGAEVNAKDKDGKTAYVHVSEACPSIFDTDSCRAQCKALLLEAASRVALRQPPAASVAPAPSAPSAPPSYQAGEAVARLGERLRDAAALGAAPGGAQPPPPARPPPAGGLRHNWVIPYAALRRGALIGGGSFGQVYAASWQHTEVAVKEFGAATASLPADQRAAILREVELLARVNHANVLRFYGYCQDPLCVVTERCARGSLFDVLQRARLDPAAAAELTWPRRLAFALDAAKGMAYLHSCQPAIIHRDLKSPNLLVDEHDAVKVGDLGLSKVAEDVAASSAGGSLLADNPRWMAPEVLRSRRAAGPESDVFSFGVVLWELLTWQVPWAQTPATAIALEVAAGERPPVPAPPDLPGSGGAAPGPWLLRYVALMERCWQQVPGDRPPFAHVVAELSAIGGEASPSGGGAAPPASPLPAASAAAASVTCCVCMERPPDAALLHRSSKTQHLVCCMACAQDLQARRMPCPFCRRPIDDVFLCFN